MFKVFTLSSSYQRSEGRIGSFLVSDQPSDYKGEAGWPTAVSFPVSMRYDAEAQRRRAYEYADYLNAGLVIQPPIGVK
jgi:murein DD-endopeptidase MepM/ murein hydrolase activator NlpD